jgi:peptidoglycan-associated lipoprotein
MKKILILLMLGLLAVGCAKKKVVAVPEAKEQEEAAVAQTEVVTETGAEVEEEVSAQEVSRAEMDITGKGMKLPGVEDIHFDFDRYEIRKESKAILMKLSDWLIKNKGSVLIEGHCDERGTNEYNLALGDRRAAAAKNFLISTGVPSSRIAILSYGEQRPLCNVQNESCWWKNRRAHFQVNK